MEQYLKSKGVPQVTVANPVNNGAETPSLHANADAIRLTIAGTPSIDNVTSNEEIARMTI